MSLRKIKVGLALLTLLSIVGYGFDRIRQIKDKGPHVGQQMPDFELTDLDGNHLAAHNIRGQKYALLVFRVGCPHCQRELAGLNGLLPQLSGKFRVIAASLDTADETRKAKEDWRLAFNLYPRAADLARQLSLHEVPLLVLVDEEGRVRYVQGGDRDRAFQELVFKRFANNESLSDLSLRSAYEQRKKS